MPRMDLCHIYSTYTEENARTHIGHPYGAPNKHHTNMRTSSTESFTDSSTDSKHPFIVAIEIFAYSHFILRHVTTCLLLLLVTTTLYETVQVHLPL